MVVKKAIILKMTLHLQKITINKMLKMLLIMTIQKRKMLSVVETIFDE